MNGNRRINYQVVLEIPTVARVGYPLKQIFPGSLPLSTFMKPGGVTLEDILEGCALTKVPDHKACEIEIFHSNREASRLIWKTFFADDSKLELPEAGALDKLDMPADLDEGEPEKEFQGGD